MPENRPRKRKRPPRDELAEAQRSLRQDRETVVDGNRLMEALELSRAMSSTLDLDKLLPFVVDSLLEFLSARRGFLLLKKPKGGMDFRVAADADGEEIDDPAPEISTSVANMVLRTGQGLVIPSAVDHPAFERQESVRRLGLLSVLCVPLISRDEVLGVIYLDNDAEAERFDQEDRRTCQIVANQAAIAIQNAQLYQELEREKAQSIRAQRTEAQGIVMRGMGEEFRCLFTDILDVVGGLAQQDEDAARRLAPIEQTASLGLRFLDETSVLWGTESDGPADAVNLWQVLTDACEKARRTARERGLTAPDSVTINQVGETSAMVGADHVQLTDALAGIVLNGLEAMPDGGELTVEVTRDDQKSGVRITDTGAGLPTATDKCLEPFFTTKGPSHQGLGLSLASAAVRRFSGELSIESREAGGTEVRVSFPLPGDAPVSPPDVGSKRISILLVEDEPDFAALLTRLLVREGMTVTAVGSVDEATSRRQAAPEAILLDLNAPGAETWKAVKYLRGDYPQSALVVSAAMTEQVPAEEARRLGADLIAPKPLRLRRVPALLEQAIRSSRERLR